MASRFLAERFAPVRQEVTEFNLEVDGAIPDWLDGRYLRNGANPITRSASADYNWFTGDGMVHGVRISDGRALWYRNRWVDSEVTSAALGRRAPEERGRSALHGPSANTNVIGFAGRTLALVEGGLACAELSDELDTVDVCDFGRTVRSGYSAHPIVDPVTGEMHAVSYHIGRGNTLRYTVIGTDGRLRKKVDVPVGGSPMVHAFSLTHDYAVIYDLPVTFDPTRAAAAVDAPAALRPLAAAALGALVGHVRIPHAVMNRLPKTGAGTLPYRWDPDYPARVGLLPRAGGTVRWLDVDPCFVFHPVNAVSHDGRVTVDVVVHDRVFDTDFTAPSEGRPRLERWRLDPAAGQVRREQLAEERVEFPRYDERFTAADSRDSWLVGVSDDLAGEHLLLRAHRDRGIAARRDFGPESAVGEFVFHPASPTAPEGEGVVMGFVSDLARGQTKLHLLDAQTLEDVAAVTLPQRVPAGFHGNWLPSG